MENAERRPRLLEAFCYGSPMVHVGPSHQQEGAWPDGLEGRKWDQRQRRTETLQPAELHVAVGAETVTQCLLLLLLLLLLNQVPNRFWLERQPRLDAMRALTEDIRQGLVETDRVVYCIRQNRPCKSFRIVPNIAVERVDPLEIVKVRGPVGRVILLKASGQQVPHHIGPESLSHQIVVDAGRNPCL